MKKVTHKRLTTAEAGELAARLTLIWIPKRRRSSVVWDLKPYQFTYSGTLEKGVHIGWSVQFMLPGGNDLTLKRTTSNQLTGCLNCCIDTGEVWSGHTFRVIPTNKWFQPFATRWLPMFRRNCWLSGFDIEATMHEKMDWMQGFGREELESWNLKM